MQPQLQFRVHGSGVTEAAGGAAAAGEPVGTHGIHLVPERDPRRGSGGAAPQEAGADSHTRMRSSRAVTLQQARLQFAPCSTPPDWSAPPPPAAFGPPFSVQTSGSLCRLKPIG